MAYLLDANVFIDAKNHYYRFDVCPGFWEWLAYAHGKDLLLSVKQVRDELLAREDKLTMWCRTHRKLFVDTNDGKTFDSMKSLSAWVIQNYQPAAQVKFLGDADFALVAFADAHSHIVVTNEVPSNGFDVKIPNACNFMDVKFVTPFQMLSAEKVQFHLSK
ncbi:MAG TPA: DUF4411 family protein [Verrucomicrobiae bacterium]|nr:DUF4411 family protein [Verrucomicrobiae bacterium]